MKSVDVGVAARRALKEVDAELEKNLGKLESEIVSALVLELEAKSVFKRQIRNEIR